MKAIEQYFLVAEQGDLVLTSEPEDEILKCDISNLHWFFSMALFSIILQNGVWDFYFKFGFAF